jgi:hypothetical protein
MVSPDGNHPMATDQVCSLASSERPAEMIPKVEDLFHPLNPDIFQYRPQRINVAMNV